MKILCAGFIENILPFPGWRLGSKLWTHGSSHSTTPSPRTGAECPTLCSLSTDTSHCFDLQQLLSSPAAHRNRTFEMNTWIFFYFSKVPKVLNNLLLFPHHLAGFVTLPEWSLPNFPSLFLTEAAHYNCLPCEGNWGHVWAILAHFSFKKPNTCTQRGSLCWLHPSQYIREDCSFRW